MNTVTCLIAACGLSLAASVEMTSQNTHQDMQMNEKMPLGNFSVSLAVKDIHASKVFYEKLDFTQVGGNIEQNWLILQNGTTTIGLFQGMFDENIMTFNPGWDKDQSTLKDFHDVREIQRTLIERGLKPVTEVDEDSKGPGNFVLVDPDGNSILFDQHVASPKN